MMSSFFLSKSNKQEKNISDRMMQQLGTAYQRALTKVLRFPKIILSGVVLLFVTALIILGTLGGEFIPS
jgi:cobalt-zinc-cadmium resistance protein CzcA